MNDASTESAPTEISLEPDVAEEAVSRPLRLCHHALVAAGWSPTWGTGCVYLVGVAPDSTEYGGSTEPGSAWDDACHDLLEEISEIVTRYGCTAVWVDDDVCVEG